MTYSTKEAHFFFYVYPSWAEVRPICIFAARLVQENEKVIATMLISPNLLDKAQDEVFAELRGDTDESVLRRIRIMSSFHSDRLNPPPSDLVPYLTDTYGAVYKDLFQGNPISCVQTGTTFDAEIPPSVVVLDIFGYTQIDATRSISGTSVPIISWLSGYVASLLHLFGPGQTGGDLVYERTTGWVVKVPGIPDMYDWEYFPQVNYGRDPIPSFVQVVRAGIWGADGAFVTSTPLFEKESLEAMKSWFSAMGQEVHVIGPLLPSEYDNDLEDIPGHTDIQLFLDKTLTARGQKSVILMSFGPLLWPRYSDHIEEVIEALIEKGFPFISCASPMARISEELRERVKLSGVGMISQWVRVPHQYILNHPATGWFITHAGHNSVMESLGSGIPMICWPFVTDQAAAAAHLTENLKVAFELIEVRTGVNGLKPLLRNGRKPKGSREAAGVEIREVIDACRGERGAELAWNALKLEARLAEAWGRDGAGRKVLRAFLNKYSRSM